jgi:hypothetical protein
MKQILANIQATMATKTDVAGIRTDVAGIRTDVDGMQATMATKTDVAGMQATMATKTDVAGIRTDVDGIAQRLDVVFSGEPAKADALDALEAAVARCADQEDAIQFGESATWTLVEINGVYYAVGALHCALFYGCPKGGVRFVSVHQSVIDCGVTQIGFVKGTDKKSVMGDKSRDLVLIKLTAPPCKTNATPLKVEKVLSGDDVSMFDSIAGVSNSGRVSGDGKLAVSLQHGESRKIGVFVETTGEPGHSGTLLAGFKRGQGYTVLGTYFGTLAAPNKSLRPRGVVSLFPAVDEKFTQSFDWVPALLGDKLQAVAVKVPAGDKKNAVKSLFFNYVEKHSGTLSDGMGSWPGFLVDAAAVEKSIGTGYDGSVIAGACRGA